MKTYLFTFSLALLLSIALTPIVIVWAQERKLVDRVDPRKVHKKPTARVGGIAIFIASMVACTPLIFLPNNIGQQFREMALPIASSIIGACIMFGVGLYDDIKNARIRTKLAAQCIAAFIVCILGTYVQNITIRGFGTIPLGWFGYILTFLWIIGITNAVNLIDGLDGLAAGIVAIGCGFLSVISIWEGNVVLATIMLSLLGALVGFLLFNFHPAKIFMGDCGSLFLGFIIATASIITASKSEALVGIAIPILVLGIPIFDTFFSMLRRFLQRRSIMSPDRAHFHHRLLDLGLGHSEIAIIAYVITFIIAGLGLFMILTRSTASILLFTCCLLLLLLVFRCVGAVRLRDTLSGIQNRNKLNHIRKMEQKQFEEAQLHLRNAKDFEQWWQCMCKAADALEFTQLCLRNIGGGQSEQLEWTKKLAQVTELKADQQLEDILEVRIPLKKTGPDKVVQQLEIKLERKGSLESAGRRITLFTRLADEYPCRQYNSETMCQTAT